MPLVLHRWLPDSHVVETCPSPIHAVATAFARSRRVPSVLAVPGETPRRPTRWEMGEGNAFCTPAAKALYGRTLAGRRLPRSLDSDYVLLDRPRRRAPPLPFPWVIEADRFPKLAPPIPAEAGPEPAVLPVPVRTRVSVSDVERVVYDALWLRGGPVWEREAAFGPGWSAKRDRIVRRSRHAVYLGHGLWALLGRDVPVDADEAGDICLQAKALLRQGPMQVAEILEGLKGRLESAARLDSPVYLAAIMRRSPEIVLDERSGYAALVAHGRNPGDPRRRGRFRLNRSTDRAPSGAMASA